MALGGDGLVAQAAPLTGREMGGQGRDWKGKHCGSWCWELGGSCILLASPHVGPLATKGGDWLVMEVDATTEPPSSPPPLSCDCRDNGEERDSVQGGAWCLEVPWQGQPLSARALQSCSGRGHGKCSRAQLLQGCWSSASGFFQLS